MSAGANLRAARATIRVLRRDGQLVDADQALVTAFLSLAQAVDAAPTNANLWRRYQDAEAALRKRDDGVGDSLAGLLARLSTPLGDTPPT